jgi:hypothetical protein
LRIDRSFLWKRNNNVNMKKKPRNSIEQLKNCKKNFISLLKNLFHLLFFCVVCWTIEFSFVSLTVRLYSSHFNSSPHFSRHHNIRHDTTRPTNVSWALVREIFEQINFVIFFSTLTKKQEPKVQVHQVNSVSCKKITSDFS